MNDLLNKLKESNFNIVYNLYKSYTSNYKIDLTFSIIEVLQSFSLIMNGLVKKI